VSEDTERHIRYRWIGRSGQFVMGIPSRDLTAEDLLRLEEMQGITESQVRGCGLYEPVETAEVAPFCGAALDNGERCRRRVSAWGERCWQHEDEEED